MPDSNPIIRKAEFSPKIVQYIILVGSLIMFATIVGIPIILFWLLGLGRYFGKRYYDNLICELTDKHLRFKKGILFKVEKTIPLENIQDLTFIENPILNYLELKILKIETAGHSNPQGSDMKLIGIMDTAEFKNEVLEQREKIRNRPSGPSSSEKPVGDSNEILSVLKEIRDLLKEQNK